MKGKFFVSFLIGLIIFSSAYMWVWSKIGGGFSEVQAIEEQQGIEQVDNIEEGNEVKQVNIDEIFFLLVGVDTTDVKNIKTSASGQTGIRSDTMILCRVNFNDGSIKMMSLPRDSRVPVKGALDKLNHSHSYGGMNLLMKTVRDFTNLDVDYYVRVDYKAVEKLVDAIGGVEVDIKQRMYKKDTTAGKGYLIDFQPGVQKLSGDQAILFLRYRDYKDGDVDRTKVQQYFLTEMIKQTLEPRNILKLPKILDVYANYVDTNMDPAMIYSAVASAGKLNKENIETTTLPGEFLELYVNDVKVSYWKVYEKSSRQEFERLFEPYLMD
ncbi:MAG: LCP family protein [Bacillota bacterium]|nr:LCP family protein [Bacillota bacterium]